MKYLPIFGIVSFVSLLSACDSGGTDESAGADSIEESCNRDLLASLPNDRDISGLRLHHTKCNFQQAQRRWQKDRTEVVVTLVDTAVPLPASVEQTEVGGMLNHANTLTLSMTKMTVEGAHKTRERALANPAMLAVFGGELQLPWIVSLTAADNGAAMVDRNSFNNLMQGVIRDRFVLKVERKDTEFLTDNQQLAKAFQPFVEHLKLNNLPK